MRRTVMSIDPGKNGGIGVNQFGFEQVVAMPDTALDCVRHVQKFQPGVCYIEKVNGYGGNDSGTGSSMFNFGHGRGVLVGALLALGWELIEVPSQRWQPWLNIGKCGGDKNKLTAEAMKRHPGVKITLATADAWLILDYAKTLEGLT